MVAISSILVPLAALVALSQGEAHSHYKRHRYYPRHFTNGTSLTGIVGTGPTGGTIFPTGTGGFPSVSIPLVTGSGTSTTGGGFETSVVDTQLPGTTVGGSSVVDIQVPVTTVCTTIYETKTYTYTLGNGREVTTTVTHTDIQTRTIEPVHGTTDIPIGSNPHEEEEELEPTTTITSTVVVTVTRHLPRPDQSSTSAPPAQIKETFVDVPPAPCTVETVFVTVPVGVTETVKETVIETVKETVKEYITVTGSGAPAPTTHLPPYGNNTVTLPPYNNNTSTATQSVTLLPHDNTTTTESTQFVTVTVVPIPYN